MANEAIQTLAASMRHAARNRQSAEIGGGSFSPAELKAGAEALAVYDDLVQELMRALPFLEDAENDPAYKAGVVTQRIQFIRKLLTTVGVIK